MTQPLLKLTGVFAGIVAAALVMLATIPAILALVAALLILLPSVVIVMAAWPVIWLARTCFGLPWNWDYVKTKTREIYDKNLKDAQAVAEPIDGREAVI